MPPRILLVGDEDSSLTRVQGVLLSWGYGVDRAADGQAALERSLILHPALVIADLGMPIVDGLGLLRALRAYQPEIPVVILTGSGGIETGLSAMQEGAYDCVTKPVDASRLRVVLERALEDGRARKELGRLRRQMRGAYGTGVLVGHSAAMQHVQRLIEMAAPTPAPVLITGETGTGKELVARTLHTLSARASGPFIAVNCSAIPETLLEGEMFGHEKGAFTGAFERRAGCFEVAHGGTIFLDEVAEMSPATQAKLLRVLEQGAVRRVGAKSELKVDVRVLAATNKDPATAIKEGALREDLYYRLNVLNIALPPLRERNEDIPLLVEEFIREFDTKYEKRIKGVDDEALQLLRAHPWPGNVRELRNTIERAIIACPGDVVTASGLRPGPVRRRAAASERGDTITVSLGAPLRDVEREVILGTLAWANDNKTRAAQILGISQKTLYNKLRAYNHGADGSFGRGDQPLSD
ncbi:MAG TPA: sigma-54 dependent transcriptional regulator [Methylomirabilota bacterium]|jgi:DNA-binding NtrC family response regulator|nr:sigma-54 dependent transcriptional regulator [Methylomirabilota bacterium]